METEQDDNGISENVLRLRTLEPSGTSLSVGAGRSAETSRSGGLQKKLSKLSKYGVSFKPPEDDAVHYASDAKELGFFQKGRDFESTFTNHKYTVEEKETLYTYESQDYLPSHSEVYKNWIKRQPSRLDWDQWLMMGLIGFIVGFIGYLLHQTIEFLTDIRIDKATDYIEDNNLVQAWGWLLGFSLLFLFFGSALIVFVRPSAGGSGLPELICFLNGTQVRHIFNVKTLVIKFFSCCLSVGSGMPVGPEGPMIHLGSLVGAGVSQFKSDTLKVKFPFFERFRNSEDRRNFVSAGAAAGVAAAFGAPVGGLLFSMEEVSSFWNEKLSWQIFFCCMVSVFTSNLGNSAFTGFDYTGIFGLFQSSQSILFKVYRSFDFHISIFVPTIIIGVLGGLLGSLFTFTNLKIVRARKSLLSSIQSPYLMKFCRLAEPIIILVIYISTSVFLPAAFGCTRYHTQSNSTSSGDGWCESASNLGNAYVNCSSETKTSKGFFSNESYNEVATLLMTNGERAIRDLFSRNTHHDFGFPSLSVVLVVYFICACWSAGTAIASGLVVPMLLIGGLYGRMVGLAMVYLFGVHTGGLWAWIDPGAMALIGAASFFGGVSRLTMSLTVIMMEITNDIQFLLPIMVAIMFAKWVGDFFTHPFYHALLEVKCIPFLSSEPIVYNRKKRRLNLELYTAGHVMNMHVITLTDKESVQKIAHLLLETTHSGFPVLSRSSVGQDIFSGTISRLELTVLLKHKASFIEPGDNENNLTSDVTAVEYEQLTIDKLEDPFVTEEMLNNYATLPEHANTKVYLRPYINQSAMTVKSNFSLHRTYIIFRSLSLRHLTVTSVDGGQVVGMITRRDLMGFNLEEKLDRAPQGLGKFATVARTMRMFVPRTADNSNSPPRSPTRLTVPPSTPSTSNQTLRPLPVSSSRIVSHSVILEAPESNAESENEASGLKVPPRLPDTVLPASTEVIEAVAPNTLLSLNKNVDDSHVGSLPARPMSLDAELSSLQPGPSLGLGQSFNVSDAPILHFDTSSADLHSDVEQLP
ncbi:chloride channel protein C-like [Watersipora subatra]|uniref:chloride channel protein C-like n=1 Tax=Watersipora subatra TaxID=2589382 RepID=UPI00355AF443